MGHPTLQESASLGTASLFAVLTSLLFLLSRRIRAKMSYGATDRVVSADRPRTPPAVDSAREFGEEMQRPPRNGVLQSLKSFYNPKFGLFLVFLAQTCGSIVRPTRLS